MRSFNDPFNHSMPNQRLADVSESSDEKYMFTKIAKAFLKNENLFLL